MPSQSRRDFFSMPATLAAALSTISFQPAKALAETLDKQRTSKVTNLMGAGIPNNGSPASKAIQKQIDDHGVVYLPPGDFLIDKPLVPRPGKSTVIIGSGPQITTLITPKNSSALRHIRTKKESPGQLSIEGVSLIGHDMSSIGVIFHGPDGSDSDSLSIHNCRFQGLLSCVWLRNCGECHFERTSARYNGVCWIMERATNIVRFSGVLCVSNRRFLHLDDQEADGYTHGISLTNSHSIFCSEEDIYLVGGQTIYIDGCSFDLGIGGKAALHLHKCQDIRFSNGWIAAGRERRDGIHLIDSPRWSITTSTINNCYRGLVAKGPALYPTAGTISGNQFGANRLHDIFLAGDVTCLIVQANQFVSLDESFPKISNRQEIVEASNGNTGNIFSHNTFAGQEYKIANGKNNIVGPNIWNVKGFKVSVEFESYNLDFLPKDASFPLNDGISLAKKLKAYI